MKLKFGFNVYEKPVEDYFQYAVEHNIGHLEIDLIKEHSILPTFTPKRIDQLRDFAEKNCIDLSFHAPYTLNLAERIPFIRKSHLAFIKKCLSVARSLNATHVTCHLGSFNGMTSWPWLRKQMLDKVIGSLNEINEYCQLCKVPLALENTISLRAGSDIYFLGDCIDDFDYIFNSIESKWMRFCLDIGHANTTEGALSYIERFKSKIINVHFHDNTGIHDDHLDIGDGTVPWEEITQALKAIPFTGPYVSECFQMKPHIASKKFLDFYQ